MNSHSVDRGKKRIVIIGGGAAGLAGALAVSQATRGGQDVDWVLLEKDNRLGGKILTERIGDFIVDGGPDCFLAEKPWVAQMAARLEISDRLLPSNEAMKRVFIFSKGKFHDLPDGVMMMVPTKFLPFFTTSLFSWPAKVRMGMDLVIPRKKDDGDESLAAFVRRRLGQECLDRLAEPMVAGVHAADPEQMSLRATFPRFLQMERKYGSLIRAFLAARTTVSRPLPLKPGSVPPTYFMTFRGGMQELTDAIANAAGRNRLLVGKRVVRVEERAASPRYLVHVEGGQPFEANAVILAAEAYQAVELLGGLDRKLAELLEGIPWTSAATISLAYRADRVSHDFAGFGFLVPSSENRKIMASTWSSTKWIGRAPEGYVLVRVFVGGTRNPALVGLDDAGMVGLVRDELAQIMGISAEPEFARVYRWVKGLPQYTMGHLERIEAIDERLAHHPGLYICGASYRGVGVGDCINSAEQAAAKALRLLGESTGDCSSASRPLTSELRH